MDSRTVLGPALVYAVTNAISAGVPILILPVMTRVLTPEEYGLVAMFTVVVTIFGAITGLSIHGAVGVRYFQREQYNLPRYVATCVLVLAASFVVTLVLVWAAASWLVELTKLPRPWLFVAVLVAAAQFMAQLRLVLWQSASQPWRFGALRIAQGVVDASASLVMVLALGMAWEGRAGGFATAGVIAGIVALVSLTHGGWLRGGPSREYAVDALRFGLPLVPHTVGGVLLAMVDRFLITNLLDVASTGIYVVAAQIGMVFGLLTDSFNKAYAPWLMKTLNEKNPANDARIVRFTYLYFLVVLAIAAALGAAAPSIVAVIAGEKFSAAAPIIGYIAFGHAFLGMYFMVASYVFFGGRTASLAGVTLTAGLFNALSSYVLIQHNGVAGAAQAFMLAQLLLFGGTWWVAGRAHPMPWFQRSR
jgi:O-antigen/teichoic acid export membrane protein